MYPTVLDLNGIELFWAKAKYLYKARVDRYKALNQPWDNMQLVREVIEAISDDFTIKVAKKGEESIQQAEPILPLPHEPAPEFKFPGFYFY